MAKAVNVKAASTGGTGVWVHHSAALPVKHRVNVRIRGFDLCAGEFDDPREAMARFLEACEFLRENAAILDENRKKI